MLPSGWRLDFCRFRSADVTVSSRVPGPMLVWAACFLLAGLLCGCSTDYHRQSADMEVYRIIDRKASLVPGMYPAFRLKEADQHHDASADLGGSAQQSRLRLSLAEAIALAGENSRQFKSRREDVYLGALDLTLERHRFAPRFSWVLSALWERDQTDVTVEDEDADTRTTTSNVTRKATGESAFTIRKTLATGAQVTLALTGELVKFLSSDPRQSAASALSLAIRQPLWQDGGRRATLEGLVQAERDMIYELRSFVRFRREFFVSVATDYYRILQQMDVVENYRVNLKNLTVSHKRAQELGKAGRVPEFQVGQAKQDELRARDRLVRAQQRYESLLDEFKITLGLPTEAQLELDPDELARLRDVGLQEAGWPGRDRAVEVGLRNRLDVATAADRAADAERKVEVAVNDLRPGLDLVAGASRGLSRSSDDTTVTKTRDSSYEFGLEIDLPLDKKDERNAYRRTLITLDRLQRSYELLRDQVKQQVYSAWRRLDEARASCEIQRESVKLAQRRVESTELLLEAGRAEMRDQLEAQEALLQAQNTLTRTLVDYRITMLELWRDVGTLTFQDGGFTQEAPSAAEKNGLEDFVG